MKAGTEARSSNGTKARVRGVKEDVAGAANCTVSVLELCTHEPGLAVGCNSPEVGKERSGTVRIHAMAPVCLASDA